MQPFEYLRPGSLDEAVSLLAQTAGKGRPLAGGTDLLVQMRAGRFELERVVDIKSVPELNELSYDSASGLTIGAAVPCYQIYENETISVAYPGLIDSVSIIGGTAIQGRASIGGNLCNASPSGDTIPTLIVLGATCNIAGPGGRRSVSADQFCIAPGTSVLQPGELLVSLHLPPPEPHSGAHYLRFIPRNEMDIAVAGAAAWLVLAEDRQTIVAARVALSAVGPTPINVVGARAVLVGATAGNDAFERAAEASRQAAKPISDMRGSAAQRVHLSGVLTKRALQGALRRAKGEGSNGRQAH